MTERTLIRRLALVLAAAGAVMLLGSGAALALINPRFTPNHLAEQSDQVLIVKLSKPDDKNRVTMTVTGSLKGAKPDKPIILNLDSAAQKEWAKKIGEMAAARGDEPAMLFIGERKEEGAAGEPVKGGLLQMDRAWLILDRGQDGVWNMSRVDDTLQGTWDGGSDMLVKAMTLILKYPDDQVPVSVNCDWSGSKTLGKVEGKSNVIQAVDLDGKGVMTLYVAATGGDKLFSWDAAKKEFADVTAARGLVAKSVCSAWGDFNGDGRLDLASWDGAALRIFTRGDKEKLDGKVIETGVKPEGGCLSLAALDVGAGKRAGLIAGTPKGPVVNRPDGDSYKAEALTVPAEALGEASGCVVADLDGDNVADILQPFEKAALVFKGKGSRAFEAGIKNDMGTGKGPACSCTGDFDADGLLDVYISGPGCARLWNNRGNLKFVETTGMGGEMCYTVQPGGWMPGVCDINNDGLQDLFIAWGEEHPHLYFNRGFRSFGKALSLIWENPGFTGATGKGQQAGMVADLNADGGQDMALVLKDGTVLVYLRAIPDDADSKPMGVQVLLPAAAGTAGPVIVTGWNDRRCLGAWSVTPGSSGAVFGLSASGVVKLKWQMPGGKPQEKSFELDKSFKVLVLGDAAK